VCKEALLGNHDDAVAHEKECTGDSATSRGEFVPSVACDNDEFFAWECDVCKEAIFDNLGDAVAHEKECTGDGAKLRSERSLSGLWV